MTDKQLQELEGGCWFGGTGFAHGRAMGYGWGNGDGQGYYPLNSGDGVLGGEGEGDGWDDFSYREGGEGHGGGHGDGWGHGRGEGYGLGCSGEPSVSTVLRPLEDPV